MEFRVIANLRCACLLAVLVTLGGCRALAPAAVPSVEPAGVPSLTPAAVSSVEPTAAVDEAAPEACGFPSGTALEYAGRSTTAALGVQEVVGDPMSVDPADVYITRDAFDRGELHGRLVCAIFVDNPGFVEVTVHPDDGGRFEEPDPTVRPTEPAGGIVEDEAVGIARAHVENGDRWELAVAEAGPIGGCHTARARN